MTNGQYIQLTIYAAQDGGAVFYETVAGDEYGTPDSRLVFGGDLEASSKYLTGRISAMLEASGKLQKEPPRQIEAPVKIRVRKPKPEADPLDVLDALEIAEAE